MHLCEASIGVMPSVDIFRRLFKVSRTGGDGSVGSMRIIIRNKDVYIGYHPQLKIEKCWSPSLIVFGSCATAPTPSTRSGNVYRRSTPLWNQS